jgi:long-subunit fatty acid transport protein
VSVIPYSSLRLAFARDTALEAGTAGLQSDCAGAPCGAENPEADQRYDVSVSSQFNIGFNVGLVVRVSESWYVGAGYVSPTSSFGRLLVEANGTVDVTPAPRDGGDPYSGQARVIYKLPQRVFLGARGPVLPRYDLVIGARFQHTARQDDYDLRMFGGDLDETDVPEWYPRFRGLNNVFGLELGIEGHDRERVRLGGRWRIETGAVDGERLSPYQLYRLNTSLAGGVEWRPSPELALSLGYAFVYYLSGSASPSAFDPAARVACVDSDHEFDQCDAAREGRGIATAEGDYSRLQHALSLGMRYDWF